MTFVSEYTIILRDVNINYLASELVIQNLVLFIIYYLLMKNRHLSNKYAPTFTFLHHQVSILTTPYILIFHICVVLNEILQKLKSV